MIQLYATLHTAGAISRDYLARQWAIVSDEDERGSVTIEQVLWAIAIIGIVTIVVGAVPIWVRGKADQLKGTPGPTVGE